MNKSDITWEPLYIHIGCKQIEQLFLPRRGLVMYFKGYLHYLRVLCLNASPFYYNIQI